MSLTKLPFSLTLLAGMFVSTVSIAASTQQAKTNPSAMPTIYVNGNWLTMSDESMDFKHGEKYAVNGVFVSEKPANARTVDLQNAYVIPPFGEAHNHNVDGPWSIGTANKYLKEGVFYLKNPNNVGPSTEPFRSTWNAPETLDVSFSHGGLSVDEGHPEVLYRNLAKVFQLDPEKLDGQAFFNVETPELLEQKWPDVVAGNPDFIKLYLLNHPAEDSDGLSAEVFRLAVEKAKQAGLRTTVHVETTEDLRLAVEAGADEAAHLPAYNYRYVEDEDISLLSDELVELMAEKQFTVVTTTRVSINFYESKAPEKLAAIRDRQKQNLSKLHKAGVPLAIGSDSYNHQVSAEVASLRDLGIFPEADLLRLWIETPALSIFPARAIGQLKPGFEASFIALNCNPVEQFDCVNQISHYEKQGAALAP